MIWDYEKDSSGRFVLIVSELSSDGLKGDEPLSEEYLRMDLGVFPVCGCFVWAVKPGEENKLRLVSINLKKWQEEKVA